MAQIERGEAKIQRRISIKRALDCKVSSYVFVQTLHGASASRGRWIARSVVTSLFRLYTAHQHQEGSRLQGQ